MVSRIPLQLIVGNGNLLYCLRFLHLTITYKHPNLQAEDKKVSVERTSVPIQINVVFLSKISKNFVEIVSKKQFLIKLRNIMGNAVDINIKNSLALFLNLIIKIKNKK